MLLRQRFLHVGEMTAYASAPAQMFDPEVLVELRRTFDSADADRSGSIDAAEACALFAKYMDPSSSPADIKRTAANLVSTLDTDRSGKLSFEEFAFRFGRKLQMELARKRRAGSAGSAAAEDDGKDHGEKPPSCPSNGLHAPPGAYMRRSAAPAYTRSAPPPPQDNTSHAAQADTVPTGSWGRESLTVLGIAVSLLALLAFAVLVPAPGDPGQAGSGARRSRSQGRTHGR
jgi:hypothetical protein